MDRGVGFPGVQPNVDLPFQFDGQGGFALKLISCFLRRNGRCHRLKRQAEAAFHGPKHLSNLDYLLFPSKKDISPAHNSPKRHHLNIHQVLIFQRLSRFLSPVPALQLLSPLYRFVVDHLYPSTTIARLFGVLFQRSRPVMTWRLC
jgi:hypothetical protein